ncbi:MAG: hypothetical protein BGO38_01270 [Cellulomonas sp. 73-145]|uniref:multiubiquitin domain-containing protein n=1 Tax=Cellulomonas sp. 73-145 TaxID=1895739 RepID=UPI00092853AF|nr:multiubiquitin domain-containing protein [Cellulomonas sp. 73-145]MBN9326705.1 multiubiquitin domain-containing protein [Cellulomonas sp.]OJV60318.1 MAG: hypothetical protein BGO38_01270 [Cellulomonas sp. 73-145]
MTEQQHSEHPGDASRYEVVVNGERFDVPDATVSFEQVVTFAYPDKESDPGYTFVVTYRKAAAPREGSLAEGGRVEIKHRGTVFNVTFTRLS